MWNKQPYSETHGEKANLRSPIPMLERVTEKTTQMSKLNVNDQKTIISN